MSVILRFRQNFLLRVFPLMHIEHGRVVYNIAHLFFDVLLFIPNGEKQILGLRAQSQLKFW